MPFLPDQITETHVSRAIARIQRDNVHLNPSTRFDVVVDGQSYPPKEIMRYAHEELNGERLWSLPGGARTNGFLERMGFEIREKDGIASRIKALLEDYKSHIKETELEDELYKWRLLKQFRGRPDLEAEDFAAEIRSVKYSNLSYRMANAVLVHIARERAEPYREAFRLLFNEEIDLAERIRYFQDEILRIYRELVPDRPHHHDERTIATFLTFRDPENYTFYKDSFYQEFCSLLGVEPKRRGEKYLHYLELIDQFVAEYLSEDEELLAIVNSLLSDDCFEDSQHKILAQDILYQSFDKKDDPEVIENETEPQIWFVCQGTTLNENEGMKYLFAPHQGAGGRQNTSWGRMKEVRKGDVIFNYSNKAFRGISIAKTDCYDGENHNPANSSNKEGYLVSIDFYPLDPPVPYNSTTELASRLKRVTDNTNGPFDVNGGIKQVYLYEFNIEAAAIVREAYGKSFPPEIEAVLSFQPIAMPVSEPVVNNHPLNSILYGPPGTGKTYTSIEKAVEVALGSTDGIGIVTHADRKREFDRLRKEGRIEFVTFHQNYSYEDFMVGIRPDVHNENLRFRTQNGVFYELARKARENYEKSHRSPAEPNHPQQPQAPRTGQGTDGSPEPLKNFVLVIDEINRANISRVFGELITLLEDDKRLGAENELRVTLPNGEPDFAVPPNLYIVGTMNTADKSIALIDIALRRRFTFIGYYPNYALVKDPEAAALLEYINDRIFTMKLSADYLIGHAYFMKYEPIETVLRTKILPLLMEYFSNNTKMVCEIFDGSGWTLTYESFDWKITKN